MTDLRIRRAVPGDFDAYLKLFPELRVDDPTPTPERWVRDLVPQIWFAETGDEVVGYCYVQVLARAGYIRHLVTAPEARRLGVGKALLGHVAEELRRAGATEWHLNVKPQNTAARALYASVGMAAAYRSWALRARWATFAAYPRHGEAVPVEDLAALEQHHTLPAGQLTNAVAAGRHVLGFPGAPELGFCAFDPAFPGAFPFRAGSIDVAASLADACRARTPAEHLNLVVEGDETLAERLLADGAELRLEILHYQGRV